MITLQLATAFVVGALAISLQTLIAERVSVKWRGLILTIPTTMASSFFFIGLVKSAADVEVVARIFPAALGADYVFVVIFALLIHYGAAISLISSALGFAAIAALIILFPPSTFAIALVYGFSVIVVTYIVVSYLPQTTKLIAYPMNAKHILGRGLIGGSIAFLAVLLAKMFGNVWGGIFSAFPASFSASLLIYSHLQGKQVIPSVAKSLFFPGSIGFALYAFTATWAFPRFGIWIGTLTCYVISISFLILYAKVFHLPQKDIPATLNTAG